MTVELLLVRNLRCRRQTSGILVSTSRRSRRSYGIVLFRNCPQERRMPLHINRFTKRYEHQTADPESDVASDGTNFQAARDLYFTLFPSGQLSDDQIVKDVTGWAFQVIQQATIPEHNGETSDLSLVETGMRESFLEACETATRRGGSVRDESADRGEESDEGETRMKKRRRWLIKME